MNFFKDMLCDKNGNVSHKRSMSMVSFLVIIQAVEMNLFTKATLDIQLLGFLMALVFGLSGAATIENMATKSGPKKTTTITSSDKVETTNSAQ